MASVLYDKLMADMKDAMKAHNMQTVNAVRGVIAKVKDLTVNAGKEITDDVVLAVVAKGVKQRDSLSRPDAPSSPQAKRPSSSFSRATCPRSSPRPKWPKWSRRPSPNSAPRPRRTWAA